MENSVSVTQRKSALIATSVLIHNMQKSGTMPDDLFVNKRELLGFQIGWLRPDMHQKVCIASGINPEECEIVLMHADSKTKCHMHLNGASTFLILGEDHGLTEPKGGVLVADFVEGKKEYMLSDVPAFTGQIVEIPAKQIHSFYGDNGRMSAIGFVYPKINTSKDEFDVVDFTFTGPNIVRLSKN